MVSEVAHKSFDNKNEKNEELIKSNTDDNLNNIPQKK